jgi:S-adenosylmethionine decarboxylase
MTPDGLGQHLLADLYGCSHLADSDVVERALRAGAEAGGATLLHLHVHRFGEGQGVTGVALLAESHISIHTWPEHGFAAVDLFLCGRRHSVPAALEALVRHFRPIEVRQQICMRGVGMRTGELTALD